MGNLNINLRNNFTLPLSISHSLNTETKPCLEPDPIEEVNAASLEHLIEDKLEDDVEFFLEEEEEPYVGLEPLDESIDPLKPPIEPRLPGARALGARPCQGKGGSRPILAQIA